MQLLELSPSLATPSGDLWRFAAYHCHFQSISSFKSA
jgi:hypothetical protein